MVQERMQFRPLTPLLRSTLTRERSPDGGPRRSRPTAESGRAESHAALFISLAPAPLPPALSVISPEPWSKRAGDAVTATARDELRAAGPAATVCCCRYAGMGKRVAEEEIHDARAEKQHRSNVNLQPVTSSAVSQESVYWDESPTGSPPAGTHQPSHSPPYSGRWASILAAFAAEGRASVAERKQAMEERTRASHMWWKQRHAAQAGAPGAKYPKPLWGSKCGLLRDYEISDTLGEGTFGVVLKGRHRNTGQVVALKKLVVHDIKHGLSVTTIREIKLLKALHHPSIVPILDVVYQPAPRRGGASANANANERTDETIGDTYMVEPYMDHDLAGLLDAVALPEPQIKLYFQQFLQGLAFLHAHNIVHRDIKSANLLLSNTGRLQIADFGLARPLHDPLSSPELFAGHAIEYTSAVVTRWYRPPELLAGERAYGTGIDLWGAGCILAEMFLRRPLFVGSSEIHQLELIAQLCGSPNERCIPRWSQLPGVRNVDDGTVEPLSTGRLDFGAYRRRLVPFLRAPQDQDGKAKTPLPPLAAALVDGLLQLDPQQRLPASEALDHEWIWSLPLAASMDSLPQYPSRREIDRLRRLLGPSSSRRPEHHHHHPPHQRHHHLAGRHLAPRAPQGRPSRASMRSLRPAPLGPRRSAGPGMYR